MYIYIYICIYRLYVYINIYLYIYIYNYHTQLPRCCMSVNIQADGPYICLKKPYILSKQPYTFSKEPSINCDHFPRCCRCVNTYIRRP